MKVAIAWLNCKINSKKSELLTQVNRRFLSGFMVKNGGFIGILGFELEKRLLEMPIFGFFGIFQRIKMAVRLYLIALGSHFFCY